MASSSFSSTRRDGELPSPLVYPLTDNRKLVQLLAEVLGEPEDEIREILYQEELCLGGYHRDEFREKGIEPYVWTRELEQYYRDSVGGLLGMASWNRRREKIAMRQWIGEYLQTNSDGRQDVLVIGDGAGLDSLYLSLCGHRVTYSEEAEPCINFARRLLEETDQSVEIISDRRQIPNDTYDVVVCLDVLEHIPEPVNAVKNFAGFLKPGGRLIVHAPFFFVSPLNPTHLRENRKYSGDIRRLFTRQGFRLADGRLFWDPLVFVLADEITSVRRAPWYHRLAIRCAGLFFWTARYWNAPHNWIAGRIMQKSNPKWLEGLKSAKS